VTSPVDDDPTIQLIDSLLDRLRSWHTDAAALVRDDDIRERVNGTLLNIDYAIDHLMAARSEKEQRLKMAS
jgi:hypothetical protein